MPTIDPIVDQTFHALDVEVCSLLPKTNLEPLWQRKRVGLDLLAARGLAERMFVCDTIRDHWMPTRVLVSMLQAELSSSADCIVLDHHERSQWDKHAPWVSSYRATAEKVDLSSACRGIGTFFYGLQCRLWKLEEYSSEGRIVFRVTKKGQKNGWGVHGCRGVFSARNEHLRTIN